MTPALVQGKQAAGAQIKGAAFSSHQDMPGEHLNREPPLGLVSGLSCVRFERRENNAKVVVLDERPRILSAVPLRFLVKQLQFPHEIELEKGTGHRWRVRSPMLVVVVKGV